MKIKLEKAKVVNGSVFPAGSVVDVDEKTARKLIDAKDAAPVSAPVKDK